MATLAQLRREAKRIGISTAVIHAIKDPSGLQSVIDDYKAHENGSETQTRSRRVVKKAVAKTTTAPRKKSRATEETAPKRRGRPPGSKNKTTAISKSASSKSLPAAKSKSGKAQRTTSATASTRTYTKKEREKSDGRYTLESVDYTQSDGWNAREGSVPDRIFKLLRKHKGNRTKVFNELLPKIGEFVKLKKMNGQKRTQDEMQAMLKYRIARTDWDFALKTGQHKQSPNWGTGQYAKTNGHRRTSMMRAKVKSAPAKKAASKKTPVRKAKTAAKAKTTAKTAPKRKSAASKAKAAPQRASGGRRAARKAVPARKAGGRGRR